MIYMIGAGGHGRVIAELFAACGHGVVPLDSEPSKIGTPFRGSLVESEDHALLQLSKPVPFFVAIGDNELRQRVAERWLSRGHHWVRAIHPASVVSRSATIEAGACVMAGAILQTECHVGRGAIVNTGAVVEHDVVLHDYCHVSPGAALAGNVTIGECAWVGTGASVIPGCSVGEHSVVGAGAVVVTDIPDMVVAYGNPCRIVRSSSTVTP